MAQTANFNPLSQVSTEALKQQLLTLVQGQDGESVGTKVKYFRNTLQPVVNELAQRNPFPEAAAQVPLVTGAWASVWSTIPFQDSLPGRLHDQSYQIFQDNGYYANIARYAPGHKLSWLGKLANYLVAYDLMLIQQYAVVADQWQIRNVRIDQAVRWQGQPLSIERAEAWFSQVLQNKLDQSEGLTPEPLKLKGMSKSEARKMQQAYQAVPQLVHLYIDQDLRIVKSQREAKQRPSYTIATRLRQ